MLFTCDEALFFFSFLFDLVSKFSKKIKEKEASKNYIEQSKSWAIKNLKKKN